MRPFVMIEGVWKYTHDILVRDAGMGYCNYSVCFYLNSILVAFPVLHVVYANHIHHIYL